MKGSAARSPQAKSRLCIIYQPAPQIARLKASGGVGGGERWWLWKFAIIHLLGSENGAWMINQLLSKWTSGNASRLPSFRTLAECAPFGEQKVPSCFRIHWVKFMRTMILWQIQLFPLGSQELNPYFLKKKL